MGERAGGWHQLQRFLSQEFAPDLPSACDVHGTKGTVMRKVEILATCSGIPDLVIQVPCEISTHRVTPILSMGYFSIQGKELMRKYVLQVNDLTETKYHGQGLWLPGLFFHIRGLAIQSGR